MFDWKNVVPGLPDPHKPDSQDKFSGDQKQSIEKSLDESVNDSIFRKMDAKLSAILTPSNIEYVSESCPFITIRNGVVGFAFGGLLGLFMSGMGSPPLDTSGQIEKITVRSVLKEMSSKTWSSAKNLGKLAVLFSATECVIEGYRAKHDIYNAAYAGCISGGIMGVKGGPKSALVGCAGFAAFSIAVEAYMNRN